METVKTEYVIQRFVHRSFGTSESHWSDTNYASFGIDSELSRKFTGNRNDENIATEVVMALSKARPAEQFRVVHRIITTNDNIIVGAGPRKPFTTNDLRKLALKPKHNGMASFNGIQDALIEANLDPCYFGVYPPKLVIHAVDTKDDPTDEWILVHHYLHSPHKGYEDWNIGRIWWNLKQKATIVSDDHFDKCVFRRHDYGDGERRPSSFDGGYKTFKGAVNRDKRQNGYVSKKEIVKRFPKTKEL